MLFLHIPNLTELEVTDLMPFFLFIVASWITYPLSSAQFQVLLMYSWGFKLTSAVISLFQCSFAPTVLSCPVLVKYITLLYVMGLDWREKHRSYCFLSSSEVPQLRDVEPITLWQGWEEIYKNQFLFLKMTRTKLGCSWARRGTQVRWNPGVIRDSMALSATTVLVLSTAPVDRGNQDSLGSD